MKNNFDQDVLDNTEQSTTYTLSNITVGPPCCDPQAHLSISNLTVAYQNKIVLADVSLSIYKGCITALIGPSGCGKTSFLSSLNRLAELNSDAKISGQIEFEGKDIYHEKTDVLMLRRKIGMIFQKPNPFPLSIKKNIELPLREHGIKKRAELDDKIETALRDVGLWDEVSDRLDSPALALSGGQQQRLCIARAIVLQPSVLLMDEPCSALDPIASAVVEDLIQKLAGRFTVVIVTHNLGQARRIANYAAFFWMREKVGKLIEFNRCQSLFEKPSSDLTAAYVSGMRG
ncbi:phosphate ABC transporter ATP-binding protein PstB [Aurantivibrio infirmus]